MDVVATCTETQAASCCVDMNQRLDTRVPTYQNTWNTLLQGRAAQEGEWDNNPWCCFNARFESKLSVEHAWGGMLQALQCSYFVRCSWLDGMNLQIEWFSCEVLQVALANVPFSVRRPWHRVWRNLSCYLAIPRSEIKSKCPKFCW